MSRLGITDLVNKIKICTNLIKLFHFEIYIILFFFISFVQICNNIWKYHLNKYNYNSQRSVIAQKLLLQLLLNFQYPITITKLFFVLKNTYYSTLAITVDYYNIILNFEFIFFKTKNISICTVIIK